MENKDNNIIDNDELVILMREECDTYHYSNSPEFTRLTYKCCALKEGLEIEPTTGYIDIYEIYKSKNDIQIGLIYGDYLGTEKKAYVSLGQEICFSIKSEDDHNPYNYFISNCYLSIVSKKYADEIIDNHNKDINKQIIRKKFN